MSMMWVKRQSKWVVAAAALLIGGSLILMDLPSAQGMVSGQSVGEVEGEEISTAGFQQELQNALRSEEARSGRQPEGAQFVQLRDQLFQFRVQNILLRRLVEAYGLRATVPEMQDWLMNNPRDVGAAIAQFEGIERVPFFLFDSTLDVLTYRNWLTQDSVYDRPGMRMLENQMRTSLIPQMQLQQIFRSQVHRTDLEENFLLQVREDRAALRYYRVNAEAFAVDPSTLDEAALRAHFEARPDSFWNRDEAARLTYLRLPLTPSAADTALMREFAEEIRERAVAGEDFADLAVSYSSDPGSAQAGGRLPLASRGEWVEAFSNVAFSLAPGEISRPVLTPFGYHIIRLHAKVREGGVEKADASHILLAITAGAETIDSVQALAETIRDRAEKSGLAAAAQAAGFATAETPVFEKGTLAPLGTFVPGLLHFSFSPTERRSKLSEVLQNSEGVYLLERAAMYPKGRDFARSREAVALDLARERALEAARAEAERILPEARAAGNNPPARLGKATLEVPGMVSSEMYVPGFGFGEAALFRAMHQEPQQWGPVLGTSEGAVIAQVTGRVALDAGEREKRVREARGDSDLFQTSTLYQDWIRSLVAAARVTNRLDEVYRN